MFDTDRFIAGFAGGLVLQFLHPLDLLRTRLQTIHSSSYLNSLNYKSYRQAVSHILRKEGRRGLYKGVTFSFLTNIMIGGFFAVNALAKSQLQKKQNLKDRNVLISFISAGGTSFFFAGIMTPFYVIKTWKLLETDSMNKTKNFMLTGKEIMKEGGGRAFYRGFAAMLAMGFNGTLTVFLNDYFKITFPNFYSTGLGNFLLGGTARLLSSSVFYPLSTVRTRMMQKQEIGEGRYNSIADCFKKTYKREGVTGFYKGFIASGSRSFLSSAFLFTTYEATYKFLKKRKQAY